MAAAFRAGGAIVAGVLLALALLIAVEFFSAIVHPLPPGFQGTQEEMCRHVEHYPQWVLAVVVPIWAATAFASVWIARRLGNLGCALVVGVLLVAALILNISMLPYPLWFKVANLITIPAAIALVVYIPGRRIPSVVGHAE